MSRKHSEWFYSVDGSQYGPVSSKELADLARSGTLKPTDLVWKEGMDKWKPAGKAKELFEPDSNVPPLPTPQLSPPSQTNNLPAAKGSFRDHTVKNHAASLGF